MCLRPDRVRPLTRHHVIELSWWIRQPLQLRVFRNAWANVVPCCRQCHDYLHSKDPEEREEARRMLRRTFTQQEIAFAIAVRSKRWLDDSYPAS